MGYTLDSLQTSVNSIKLIGATRPWYIPDFDFGEYNFLLGKVFVSQSSNVEIAEGCNVFLQDFLRNRLQLDSFEFSLRPPFYILAAHR